MFLFSGSVYRLISIPLQGVWESGDKIFKFNIEFKPEHLQTPTSIVDMVLYINNVRKGIVDLKFSEEGVCYIHIDGVKSFMIHLIHLDDHINKMVLVDPNNTNITFKKTDIL